MRPWAGENWIGGVLVAGGFTILCLGISVGNVSTNVRPAGFGALILAAGVGTIIHARREAKAQHCVLCTNELRPETPSTRCRVCDAALHAKCTDTHMEVYHPEPKVPGAGPYRSRK